MFYKLEVPLEVEGRVWRWQGAQAPVDSVIGKSGLLIGVGGLDVVARDS